LNIFVSLNLFSNLQNIWVKLLDFCRFKMAYNGPRLYAGRVSCKLNLFFWQCKGVSLRSAALHCQLERPSR
jgi:hypothetical protein